jgi:hypothetical protein
MMRIAIAVLATFFASVALAQSYPTKPIRFIVATGPGGADDFLEGRRVPQTPEVPAIAESLAGFQIAGLAKHDGAGRLECGRCAGVEPRSRKCRTPSYSRSSGPSPRN